MVRKVIFVFLLLIITGCSAKTPQEILVRHQIAAPGINNLEVCVSYACRHKQSTYLTPEEWDSVALMMTPGEKDSAWLERRRIAETIGLLERIVGPKVGTQHNMARNGNGPAGSRQLDCVAEAVNTTIYLQLLQTNDLLRHHHLVAPVRKGPVSSGTWLHFSAAIEENQTGKRFAVDPWFYDNGHPAVVISLERWMLPNRKVN